jgi:prepilin-type N-terminal cleavage/methylation domain-containing protein
VRRSWHNNDTGFTLVELLVTMFVIAGALLALLPLQVKAQQTVALGRERQQATALANQAIEKVRGRATETGGAAALVTGRTPITGDTNVTGCPSCRFRPSFDTSIDEQLRTSGNDAVLAESASPAVNGTVYTTRLYVTTPAVGAARSADITAVTTWNSRQASNRPNRVAVRTTVLVP